MTEDNPIIALAKALARRRARLDGEDRRKLASEAPETEHMVGGKNEARQEG